MWGNREDYKFLILKNKLLEEARNYFFQVYENGLKYDEIKRILIDRFEKTYSTPHYYTETSTCKQKQGEDILAYAARLKRKVFSVINITDSVNQADLSTFRYKFMTSVFINGLNPKVMASVLLRYPRNFDEAVQMSLKANEVKEQLKSKGKVLTVKEDGHYAKDGPQREENTHLIQAL
ncbi:Uncharacterised protein at_DN2204 [Pycnogonum litorale]